MAAWAAESSTCLALPIFMSRTALAAQDKSAAEVDVARTLNVRLPPANDSEMAATYANVQFAKVLNGPRRVWAFEATPGNLARISEVAQELRGALERANWQDVGRLMREEWSFRKRNLPTITTKTIDRIVENARKKGALAGKVCGAGGGGCVVLLIEPEVRERVEAAVSDSGGEVLPMKVDRSGVQVNVS